MGKPNQKVVTHGVQALGLPPVVMNLFFRKAESFLPKHEFLVFEPQGNQVVIGDGDGKQLDTMQMTLPEKVWVKTDDYGDRLVITALLPREY
ncbi:hypothetical protein FE782_28610 [Paenibacillus antri]|uniref:Uncharacterized protein n=1 Tax=Paenibacillus antri TaxID=2582848 RepID=A0A5R9G7V0_9BACL|nr:hypothetical protein [Paenibacillus antri]TLS48823.1 hypothetical protein FE782_28610 [Paenibacillus antri]